MKTTAHILAAAIAWVGSGPDLYAQDLEREVDLEELITIAVRTSPALLSASLERQATLGRAVSSEGVDDFLLGASVDLASQNNASSPGQPVQTISSQSLSMRGSIGRSLPTGGDLELSVSGGQQRDTFLLLDAGGGPGTTLEGQRATGGVDLSLRQSLLRGRGENVARSERRIGRISRKSADYRQQLVAEATILDIVNRYWDLTYAAQSVDIHTRGLISAEKQLEATRSAIASGALPRSELLTVEHRVALWRRNQLAADLELLRTSLQVRRTTGMDLGGGQILRPTDSLEATRIDFDIPALVKRTTRHNPLLKLAHLGVGIALIDDEVAENRQLAVLDLHGSVGSSGIGNDHATVIKQIGNFDSTGWSAGMRLSYELGNRTGTGSRQATRARLRLARLSAREVERELAAQTTEAVLEARLTYRQVLTSRKAVKLAIGTHEAEQARFRAGRSRIFDVLERQELVLQSRLQLAAAIRDQRKALAQVAALTGQLLKDHGVALD